MGAAASMAAAMLRGHVKRKRVIQEEISSAVAGFLADYIEQEARVTTFTDPGGCKHRIQGASAHYVDGVRIGGVR